MKTPEDEPAPGSDSFIDRLRRENAWPMSDAGIQGELLPGSESGTAADASASRSAEDTPDDTADGPADDSVGDPVGDPVGDSVSDPESDPASNLSEHDTDDADGVRDPELRGRLPPEARRVLVSLMRQGVVLAARKAKVFEALVRHEDAIRSHLAELYLQLVLDERAGVAFIQSRTAESLANEEEASDDGDALAAELDDAADGATLIAKRTLSLYDTLLLLILRKHYQDRESAGEQRIVIDIERVESAFVPFLPLTASERSDRRQLNAAMTRLLEKRLLSRVRGDDERFEITPVIRYVVDAAFLQTLLAEYQRLAGASEEVENGENDEDHSQPTGPALNGSSA